MGYVYLLCDASKDYVYKIGVTRGDITKRIKKLQTGNSGEIFICKRYETKYPFFIEKQLHRRLEHKKILNEWFELNNDDVLNFESMCKEIEKIVDVMKDNPFFPKNLK